MMEELIGQATFQNILESDSALTSDIIYTIEKNFERARMQVAPIAHYFKGSDIMQTAFNVWKFLRQDVQYIKDPQDLQFVKLPARFIAEKIATWFGEKPFGDCKSYSEFASAVMSWFAPIAFRYANYVTKENPNPGRIPSHVYTVVKPQGMKEIIVDGVWPFFNDEKWSHYQFDHDMKVYTLAGVEPDAPTRNEIIHRIADLMNMLCAFAPGDPRRERIINAIQQLRQGNIEEPIQARAGVNGIGNIFEDIWQGIKKFFPLSVAGRKGYIELTKHNYFKFADKLNRAHAKDAQRLWHGWTKLGGNPNDLWDAIQKGEGASSVAVPDLPTLYGWKFDNDFAPKNVILVPSGKVIPVPASILQQMTGHRSGENFVINLISSWLKSTGSISGIGQIDPGTITAILAGSAGVIAAMGALISSITGENHDDALKNIPPDQLNPDGSPTPGTSFQLPGGNTLWILGGGLLLLSSGKKATKYIVPAAIGLYLFKDQIFGSSSTTSSSHGSGFNDIVNTATGFLNQFKKKPSSQQQTSSQGPDNSFDPDTGS